LEDKTMSKLYTEEQVRQIFENLSTANGYDYNMETYCDSLTPISLPSDEEIDVHVKDDFLKMIIKHYHNSLFYLELTEIELENITKMIYKEIFGGQDNE